MTTLPAHITDAAQQEVHRLLQSVDGLQAAVVATVDGFEVAQASHATIDAARMAAMASSVCALGEAVAREAGLGNYVSATIEAAQGRAILYAIPRADVPLVLHLLASEQSMLAHIMYAARQTADTLSAS